MRVNITLACTECGDRNYISKKINVTIQTVLSLKSTAQEKNAARLTVKQSKQQDFSCCFFYAFFYVLTDVL